MNCFRCGKFIHGRPEFCWYCEGELCKDCWEKIGHCGHPEADEVNRLSAKATSWKERHKIFENRTVLKS